jgi:predicted transcriptional regulator
MHVKELFKFWLEKEQREQLEVIAEREKTSVSFMIRKAIDEFLAKRKGKK